MKIRTKFIPSAKKTLQYINTKRGTPLETYPNRLKVPQTNKWSWDQALDLPIYVVHIYLSYFERNIIVCLNFRGHAILPFTLGIVMAEKTKQKHTSPVFDSKISSYKLIFHPNIEEHHINTFRYPKNPRLIKKM